MAKGQENLIPMNERTKEEQKKIATMGGIRSGEVRREKATMRKMLEMCLEMTNNQGKTYKELSTLGLIKGAMNGNANNYRTILETLGELKAVEEDRQQAQLTKVEELLSKLEDEANK